MQPTDKDKRYWHWEKNKELATNPHLEKSEVEKPKGKQMDNGDEMYRKLL